MSFEAKALSDGILAKTGTPAMVSDPASSGFVMRLMITPIFSYTMRSSATPLNGGDNLGALLGLVRDQQKMGHLLHYAPLDLLDTCFAVDNDVVEAVGQNADNFLKVRIYLAVASGALRSPDCEKSKAGHLNQRVKNPEPRFAEKLQRFPCLSVFNTVHDAHTDIVQRQLNVHAKSYGKTDSGIRINRQYLLVRIISPSRSLTMEAEIDVFPTPPLPATAIILAALSIDCPPLQRPKMPSGAI
jgi:hypothetical protein